MRKNRNNLGRNFQKKRTKDKLGIAERGAVMSAIKSRGTKFEVDFTRRLSEKTKNGFLTNVASIKGKPDIVFVGKKICVFLDSNFWHGWYYPRWRHQLKDDFWRSKIENNRKRDKKITEFLRRNGWTVLRFWEHQIKKDPDGVIKKIIGHL